MDTYRVFKRSARDFAEFAKARKVTVERGVSLEDARRMCKDYNDNRTSAQLRKGTKMEFEKE